MTEEEEKKKIELQCSSIDLSAAFKEENQLLHGLLSTLKKSQDEKAKAQQLSFDSNPTKSDNYSSVYKRRLNTLPPHIAKRIRDSEELVGGVIIPVRGKQLSLFARPRANRFDVGITINLKPEAIGKLNENQQKEYKEKIIPQLREILINCGDNSGVPDREKRTLSQLFIEINEDWLTFGAFAVEVREDEQHKFHSFRAVDAGTIYFTTPQKGSDQEQDNIRKASAAALQALKGVKVDVSKFNDDHYTYVQVVDNIPRQVFTDKELLYWSSSQSTDIERSGYPVSPLERILNSIMTHMNLVTHNKMFFINGRASRNILVFQSDNLEKSDVEAMKAQMVGHINSSNAAHRLPVFGIGASDKVEVVQLDPTSRDMEFQYLADLNKRMLFAAYQMSPDEVAALSYLSRGTNSQSLSESNNEWKLVAARDIGLRPMLLSLEDFLNYRLLPRIDAEWSKYVQINLEGIDADNPEKEASRLQQDAAIFATMDDIMERVEKPKMPIAGNFPLNAAFMQIVEKYYTKGEILKAFGGPQFKDADKNEDMKYYMNDQVWLKLQELKMNQQTAMAQAQAQAQQVQQQQEQTSDGQDLDTALSQLGESLSKSEKKLPFNRKDLLKRHRFAKKKIMQDFEKDSKELMEQISKAIKDENGCC